MADPTRRELEEPGLREDLARYRLIFETAAVGLGLGTPDGRMAEANPFLCEMLGYSRGELIGRSSLLEAFSVGRSSSKSGETTVLIPSRRNWSS